MFVFLVLFLYPPPLFFLNFLFTPALLVERFFEFLPLPCEDRFSSLFCEGEVVVEIVQGGKSEVGDFIGAQEVVEVGAREVLAGVAAAFLIDGGGI